MRDAAERGAPDVSKLSPPFGWCAWPRTEKCVSAMRHLDRRTNLVGGWKCQGCAEYNRRAP